MALAKTARKLSDQKGVFYNQTVKPKRILKVFRKHSRAAGGFCRLQYQGVPEGKRVFTMEVDGGYDHIEIGDHNIHGGHELHEPKSIFRRNGSFEFSGGYLCQVNLARRPNPQFRPLKVRFA